MRILPYVFLLLMGMTWRCVQSTCVLETDFGLSINCGLKKTGMFRVRNLGGLKGYVGLGIQLADELGFKESLSSLEQNNKRRSVNGIPATGSFEPLAVPQNNNRATTAATNSINNVQDRSTYAKMNGRAMASNKPATVPPFRPLMAAANNVVRNVRLAAQQQQQQPPPQQQILKPLPVPAFAALPESIANVAVEAPAKQQNAVHRQSPSAATPSVGGRPAGGAQTMHQPTAPAAFASMHQQQQSIPSPVFKTSQPQLQSRPQPQLQPQLQQQMQQQLQQQMQQQLQQQMQQQMQPQMQQQLQQQMQPQLQTQLQPQPQQSQQQISTVYYQNAMQQAANRRYNAFTASPQNSVDVRPIIVLPTVQKVDSDRKKQPDAAGSNHSPLSNEVDPASMMSLFNVAAANNVSVEQLAMALRVHQQQQHNMQQLSPSFHTAATEAATTTTTTTTTTPPPTTTTTTTTTVAYEEPPVPKKTAVRPYKTKYAETQKVMNAPMEYYPVGYDKNFDDNFVSKVDLPDTSFSCGDQKHFPGLYGDEDLGCMVFHVCAFTDDGLTQKSFLCPESTLFDQTILKCNWWFYVDCKSSRKLYDSNIPISKSYQLMKALTFFSSYSAGTTVDASVAAATAAVSPPDVQPPPSKSDAPSADVTPSSTTGGPSNATEVLDNVAFRRRR